MVLTRPVRLLNWCQIHMLRLYLKFLISVVNCFKLLPITKVSDYGAFKLHLLSDILSLSWIFFRFKMQHKEFMKDDISTQNDLSFRWRPNSESFESISVAHKDTLLSSRLQLTFTYMIVYWTSKHLQYLVFNRFVRPYLNRGHEIYSSGRGAIHEIACCIDGLSLKTPIQP